MGAPRGDDVLLEADSAPSEGIPSTSPGESYWREGMCLPRVAATSPGLYPP
jgi:hypothetical protein